jgi:hypothetical protein
MTLSEQEQQRIERECMALANEFLQRCGMQWNGETGAYEGLISIGVAGGAMILAAGWIMSAANDENFEAWISSVRSTRAKTRAVKLAKH